MITLDEIHIQIKIDKSISPGGRKFIMQVAEKMITKKIQEAVGEIDHHLIDSDCKKFRLITTKL